jgi:hypothetical protein
MSVVERIARVIDPQAWAEVGSSYQNTATLTRVQISLDRARAAIRALREPTPAMLAVYEGYHPLDLPAPGEIYQRMIDAILEEK